MSKTLVTCEMMTEAPPEWAEAPISTTLPMVVNPSSVAKQRQEKRVLIAYKVIAVIDGRYYSLVKKGRVEYIVGQPMRQLAKPNHGGGFYVHAAKNVMHIVDRFKAHDLFSPIDINSEYGVLECEVEPPFVYYDRDGNTITNGDTANIGKISASYLLPVRFHGSFRVSSRPVYKNDTRPVNRTPSRQSRIMSNFDYATKATKAMTRRIAQNGYNEQDFW